MNEFIDNNSKILEKEKSVIDIFIKQISLALTINSPISIFIITEFNFFHKFKKISPYLKKLEEKNLLKNISILMVTKNDISIRDFFKEFTNDAILLDNEDYIFINQLYEKEIFNLKFFLDKRMNLKMFIFDIENHNPYIIIGSSNLSDIPKEDEIEFSIGVYDDKKNLILLEDWWKKLWENSYNKLLGKSVITILEETSKQEIFQLKARDFIVKMISMLKKEYLVKNIISDLSVVSEFKYMSYYNSIGTLNQYGIAFLLNTGSIGKIEISVMIAKYFLEQDNKIMVIHSPTFVEKWEEAFFRNGIKKTDLTFISRSEMDSISFNYQEYADYNLIIVEDALFFKNNIVVNNRDANFKSLLNLNEEAKLLFLSTELIKSSLSDFLYLLKYKIKDTPKSLLEKDILKKIFSLQKSIKENKIDTTFIANYKDLLSHFCINIKIADLPKYICEFQSVAKDNITISQVKYAYDHEIYVRIYDRLVNFITSLNFQYILLWGQEIDDSIIFSTKWNLYKKLESSIFAYRITLEKILEKNMEVRAVIEGVEYPFKHLNEEQIFYIGKNIENKDKDKILEKIDSDMKNIKSQLTSINTIKYLENRDDKITNLLKIIKSENSKPTIIFTESKESAFYIYKRLKNYGLVKTKILFSNEYTLEGLDDINEVYLGKDFESIVESIYEEKINYFDVINNFNIGVFDILISTDILDENIIMKRGEILINFDIPQDIFTLNNRNMKLSETTEKKIKIFNFFPDKRIEKGTNILEELIIDNKSIASLFGFSFIDWVVDYSNDKNFFLPEHKQELIYSIRNYRELLSTRNPETLQFKLDSLLIKQNIVIRDFLKRYGISEDTVKMTTISYNRPIFTVLKGNIESIYVFFRYKNDIHTINEFYFSDRYIEEGLSGGDIKHIEEIIIDKIRKEYNIDTTNISKIEDFPFFKELKIGIIKYIK